MQNTQSKMYAGISKEERRVIDALNEHLKRGDKMEALRRLEKRGIETAISSISCVTRGDYWNDEIVAELSIIIAERAERVQNHVVTLERANRALRAVAA